MLRTPGAALLCLGRLGTSCISGTGFLPRLRSEITERRHKPPESGSPMLERIVGRVVAVLDWLWPLPLGALFGALLFLVTAGTWLAFRGPAPTATVSSPRSPQSEPSVPEPREFPPQSSLPTASDQTGPVTNSDTSPVGSVPSSPTTTGRPSRVDLGGSTPPSQSSVRASEATPAPAVKALPQTALVQSEVKRAPVSKPTPSTPVGKLSPAQQAALQDKLTLGGFFIDRQDYPAAIREFQAALAIDPANHEAQAAIQRAHKADKEPEPGTLP